MKNAHKPSIKDIRNALNNSGYLLEHRICPILEEYGYHTDTNVQYEDVDSGKSCEFDVQATKTVFVEQNKVDSIGIILLISCKNNHYPVLAMTRKVNLPTLTIAGRIVNLGTPLGLGKGNDHESLEEHFKMLVCFSKIQNKKRFNNKEEVLIKYAQSKKSYSQIGDEYNVSKVRIFQIVNKERKKFSKERITYWKSKGLSLREIAKLFKKSHEAVRSCEK